MSSSSVTIVYPPGCREVTDDLGSDELIRRLKTLAHTFQMLSQAEDESTYADYTPLANHLADDHFLSHQSRDVQLLVACCIADILRIFAPDAPYKDPAQIKTIFYFLIKQLGGLKDPKDPAFKRYFYLLENLAYVKSFNMCFDLEECNEIVCALYQLVFKIVNEEHSGKVKTFMLEVLSPLITEADFVANELLDIVLIHIVAPLKTQKKVACSLARDLVTKTAQTLEPYIQQFFNQVLILGKADQKLQISSKVYDLIYELNLISPRILLTVLPQLEFKLKSSEESERMGSVALLARMFSEKGSSLARNHRQLWLAFLGRYNDISVAIRIKCVQYTMHFLLNHPELLDDVVETLKLRQHDSEEAVRYEVVIAIVSTAKKNFDVVSQSEELLNFVKERTLDKKFRIRKEAVTGLGDIYRHYLDADPASVPEATKKAVTWIKDKILHGYYMPNMEDRLLVERLINTCLVPFNREPLDRMKKLLLLYGTIDDNASKAFIEVQKNQFLIVRKAVADMVTLHRADRSDPAKAQAADREIQQAILQVSKHLPESVKATEYLRKFSAHMLDEKEGKFLLETMEKVVCADDVSCSDCVKHVTQLLKKFGFQVMTNLYYRTIKQLLERVSSVMIDGEAIAHLVDLVKEALEGGPVLEELGLDQAQAGERGLKLLLLLSFVFPSHFLSQGVIKNMIYYLSIKGDGIAPLTLSALSFVGKHRPLGDDFPEMMSVLVPICKQFIARGDEKQAKQAVKCLYMNTTSTQDVVFAEVLETVRGNLDPEKGEAYKTAVVALGHIAFHLPDKFPIHVKNLVSRKIVKELLMQDREEARRDDDAEWCEFEELPLETQCKIEGLKMMARWLVGLRDDREDDPNNSVTISAQKTFRMLNAIIENKGDLLDEGKPSPAERAWFRLAAGCAVLKICEQKGVGDRYTLEQFYTLSTLFVDPVPQVREKILVKLHKGLGRSIANKCLPLDFMGLFVLCGLETDKRILKKAKSYMTYDINKRKEYVKGIMLTGTAVDRVSQQLDRILPDYMLVFAVPILSNLPDFQQTDDPDTLKRLQAALWFIMEPLMTKNDNFSFSFYKTLLEKVKTMRDKRRPEDDLANRKMWTVCDLALSLLINKTTNYELREFPGGAAIRMPSMVYAEHDDPNFVNAVSYLPSEFVPKNPKKAGIMGHFGQQGVASVAGASGRSSATARKARAASAASADGGEEVTTVIVTSGDAEEDDGADANGGGAGQEFVVEVMQEEQQEEEGGEPSKASGGRATRKRGKGAAPAVEEAPPEPAAKRGRAAAAKAAPAEEESTSSGRPRRAARK